MEPNLGAIALTSADTVPWSAPFDPEVGGSWLCSVPFGAHLAASVLVHSQLHPVELQWHLTLRPTVRPGDEVDAGDPLGAVGITGLTTGPHLHFVIRRGGEPIDPRGFLPQR